MSKKRNLKKLLVLIPVAGILFVFLTFLITSLCIGKSVQRQCKAAQENYEGDCTEALIQAVEDTNAPSRERNSAIWALGQIGAGKATPILEKYYTGNIPPREPLEEGVSQYELKKGLHLTQGGFNISALVWKNVYPTR